jgi:invasion protein IalB
MSSRAWNPELDEDDRRRPQRRRRSPLLAVLWTLIAVLVLASAAVGYAFYAGWLSLGGQRPAVAGGASASQSGQAAGGQTSGQPAAVPQPTVISRETIGDWVHVCVQLPNSDQVRCGISQQLTNSQSGASVFLWRIVQDGNGGFVGEWETPTGVVVGRGIVLDAGTEKPVAIPFQACTQSGCIAVANLAPDFLDILSRTQQANAVVYPIGQQGVRLNLSVKGLADGLVALGYKPGAAPASGPAVLPPDSAAAPAAQTATP